MDKALAKLKAENPDWDVIGMAPDLTDYAAVEAAFAEVAKTFGRVDILVNNAGISARESLYNYDPAAFKKIMDLNVTAGGYGQARLRTDPAGAHGRTAGGCQRVPVPGQRPGKLRHRRDPLGGWRGTNLKKPQRAAVQAALFAVCGFICIGF